MAERSLTRQSVIEEDEYLESISRIIARDFFPSLAHLDATNDYLDAVHSRDPALINASVRRLEQVNATPSTSKRPRPPQTPSETPYCGNPSDTPRTEQGPSKRPRYDNLSLDQFQAKFTSEDNASFVQILDQENATRKERWSWAWDAQKRVEAQNVKMIEDRKRHLLEAPELTGVREKFTIEAPVPAGLIKAKEGVEETEKGAEPLGEESDNQVALRKAEDVMAPKKDTRSAGVDGWKFKARNSLMFPPDANTSPYDTVATQSNGDPKSIKHGGTRLSDSSHNSSIPSPTRSFIDAAISGEPYQEQKEFGLVPNLPSPTPSEIGPAAVKQLLTYGTLLATPRLISQSEGMPLGAPSTPFHLPAISKREAISQRLSNTASKNIRARAGQLPNSMAPPSWTPRKSESSANLTPAGRRLLDRTLGTAAMRRQTGKGKETDLNRVRWTPSPATRR